MLLKVAMRKQHRRFTLLVVLAVLSVMFIYYMVILPSHPTLDFYAPINESQPRRHQANVTYSFPKEGPYLYSAFMGRLGNHMFQYAALYAIARKLNMTPVIYKNAPLLTYFRRLSALKTTQIKQSPDQFHIFRERSCCAFDPTVFEITESSYLQYFYQSWRYFDHVRDEIRQEFKFKDYVYERALRFLEDSLKKFDYSLRQTTVVSAVCQLRNCIRALKKESPLVTLVGIHVRRGDVLLQEKVDFGYTVPNASYFAKAMAHFRRKYENVVFIVCSNGPDWVKENIKGSDVIISEGYRAEVDLAVLTLCNHMILSEGSFSWWAAYLVPGEVFYFDDWPRKNSILDGQVVKEDYFLPNWHALSESRFH